MLTNQRDTRSTEPFFVIVEGNIGAGKSTFLRLLKENLPVHIVLEPLEKWQSIGGSTENLLEKFYQDTPRWAYTFQSYAFITRILAQEQAVKNYNAPIYVLERSVFSDRYCFAQNCFENGLMTTLEWKLYQEWFSWLVDSYMSKPHGFIYLSADPKTCYNRLLKRNRREEAVVPMEYLEQLHEKHENWLVKKENVAPYLKDLPVLTIPCNNDFEHNKAEQELHINRIATFFNTHFQQAVTPQMPTSLSL
jgi:deoxyadenosine/deoxycytidine kinase